MTKWVTNNLESLRCGFALTATYQAISPYVIDPPYEGVETGEEAASPPMDINSGTGAGSYIKNLIDEDLINTLPTESDLSIPSVSKNL